MNSHFLAKEKETTHFGWTRLSNGTHMYGLDRTFTMELWNKKARNVALELFWIQIVWLRMDQGNIQEVGRLSIWKSGGGRTWPICLGFIPSPSQMDKFCHSTFPLDLKPKGIRWLGLQAKASHDLHTDQLNNLILSIIINHLHHAVDWSGTYYVEKNLGAFLSVSRNLSLKRTWASFFLLTEHLRDLS